MAAPQELTEGCDRRRGHPSVGGYAAATSPDGGGSSARPLEAIGDDYPFSAFAAASISSSSAPGRRCSAAMSASGLEHSLFIGRNELAKSNAEQVAKVRELLEALGREIATPAEARAMLALKGGDNVGSRD